MVNVKKIISATLPLLGAAVSTEPGTIDYNIKSAGRKYFGTATDKNTLSNPKVAAIVAAEFGTVTPENSMKWESTEPTNGVFTFDDSDYLVEWAENHEKQIRGHTLVWHSQLPTWVSNITDKHELVDAIEVHINTLVKRYRGKIYAWDVVNEVFNEDGTFRSSVFYDLLGKDFIKLAFKTAHAADPHAKLYINDYNLDYTGPKIKALVNLVKELKHEGVPIHGIGTQTHLTLDMGAINSLHTPLAELASTGCEIAMTEIDIRMPTPSNSTSLADQKRNYEEVVSACISIKSCIGISVWGVSDKNSWVPAVFSGEGVPLLWDENFRKKPAYYGAQEGLKNHYH